MHRRHPYPCRNMDRLLGGSEARYQSSHDRPASMRIDACRRNPIDGVFVRSDQQCADHPTHPRAPAAGRRVDRNSGDKRLCYRRRTARRDVSVEIWHIASRHLCITAWEQDINHLYHIRQVQNKIIQIMELYSVTVDRHMINLCIQPRRARPS